jgi:TatD DNase family protein
VEFADSHVHLADAAFRDDVDLIITRARAAGARALVCIGESPEAASRARAVAGDYPGLVFHTTGLHPHAAADWDPHRHPDAVREGVVLGAVAIGECGLDYHYDFAPRDRQRAVLDAQVGLAAELGKPLVIHTRDAEDDTIAFLRAAEAAGVRGVLHCFTGSPQLAAAALSAGWMLSFSGVVTFKRWTDDALVREIPADRLLAESDAPYLAPVPFRGKRNESSWVPRTIARLAQARGITPEQCGRETMANCCALFDLSVPATPVAHDPLPNA